MTGYATESMTQYEKLRKEVASHVGGVACGWLLVLAGAGLAIAALVMSSAVGGSEYVNHDRMLTRLLLMMAGLGCFIGGAVVLAGAFVQGAIGRAEASRRYPD